LTLSSEQGTDVGSPIISQQQQQQQAGQDLYQISENGSTGTGSSNHSVAINSTSRNATSTAAAAAAAAVAAGGAQMGSRRMVSSIDIVADLFSLSNDMRIERENIVGRNDKDTHMKAFIDRDTTIKYNEILEDVVKVYIFIYSDLFKFM